MSIEILENESIESIIPHLLSLAHIATTIARSLASLCVFSFLRYVIRRVLFVVLSTVALLS